MKLDWIGNRIRFSSDAAANYVEDEITPLGSDGSNTAIVEQSIVYGDRGRVQYAGSWWFARCTQPITLAQGTMVRVIGMQNITLVVEPV